MKSQGILKRILSGNPVHILCNFSHICNFGIFDQIFMEFSPKCRTKKLGTIYTIEYPQHMYISVFVEK